MSDQRPARRDRQRGQMVVLFAVGGVMLFGFAGLLVDGAMGYRQHQIQANAAAAAARAAAVYLAENRSTATDQQVECLTALFTDEDEEEGLAQAGRCPAAGGEYDNQGFIEFANPVRGQSGAWYLDSAGNEVVAVGTVNSGLPVLGFLQATYGTPISGIRVYSSVDMPTSFVRVLGITQVHVAAGAAYRMGSVSTFLPGAPLTASVPNPSGAMQNGISVFPIAFSQQAFAAAGLQNPANNPTVQQFAANDGAAGFFWSSLQCQSNSNADTKAWLQQQDPCPSAGPAIAASGTPNSQCANGGPGPASCISTQPGIRAVDYRLSDPYVGQGPNRLHRPGRNQRDPEPDRAVCLLLSGGL